MLTALREKLDDARRDRPEMLDEINIIDGYLANIEDMDKYDERFEELERVMNRFIDVARGWPLIPSITDRKKRLVDIRDDLNVYRNAYTTYRVRCKKHGD
jgi:hypothetical protein